MNQFLLTVSTPSGNKFDGYAIALTIRLTEGDRTIMAGHIPFIGTILKKKCRIQLPNGEIKYFLCSDGILSVGKDRVRVLVTYFREMTKE